MTDDDLRIAIKKLRSVAQPIGPMHAFWDVISDAEACLNGKPEMSFFGRAKTESMVAECIADCEQGTS